MSKILVKDLKELAKGVNYIKNITFNELNIELKTYLPITDKINLVSSVYESAIDKNNGLHIVRRNALDITFKILFLERYTNINLPKDTVESYNLIMSTGLYDFVYGELPESEREELDTVLWNLLTEKDDGYEQNLKLEKIIKDGVDGLLQTLKKVEGHVPELVEVLKNFDSKDFNFVQDFIKINRGEV